MPILFDFLEDKEENTQPAKVSVSVFEDQEFNFIEDWSSYQESFSEVRLSEDYVKFWDLKKNKIKIK